MPAPEQTQSTPQRALLRVCTLGPLEVHVDGVRRDLRRPVERQVLGALAAAGGDFVDGDELVELVWPAESGDTDRRRALATTIWRLRQTLAPAGDAIVARTNPLAHALAAERTEFTATTFESLRRAGREHLFTDDLDGAVAALTAAVGLWRGDPLEGLGDHRQVRARRVHLAELHRGAVEDLASALVRTGRTVEAVGHLEALVREEPLREQAWALLVRALLDLGRDGDAANAVDTARRHLAEVGMEPGLALRRAAGDILEQAAALGDAQRERSAVAGAIPNLPGRFVGRSTEVERLVEQATLHGSASCVAMVLGSPGAGKTRLAVEVMRHVDDRPSIYVSVTREARHPLGAVAELVRLLIAAAQEPIVLAPELERLLDPGGTVLQPDDIDADDARAALVDAVLALIAAVCPKGCLIVIDDAHAAPPTTLALLHRLALGALALPVTVLALVRTPVHDGAVFDTAQRVAASVVRLGGLAGSEVEELARGLMAGSEVDDAMVRWLVEQTGGNPLFVSALLGDEEVRRALADGVVPPRRDGLDHAVAGFLAAFDGRAAHVLRSAALLGRRPFDAPLLAEVVAEQEIGIGEVEVVLDRALRHRVLLDGPRHGSFVFAHGLIRDVLVAEIEVDARPRQHRACAVALERRAALDPDLVHDVADHHARAWPHTTAVAAAPWLVRSATAVSRLTEHGSAASSLETAAALLAREPGAPVRLVVEVELMLARVRIDLADPLAALAATRRAAHVARAAGWADGVAMAAIRGADIGNLPPTDRDEVGALLIEAAGLDTGVDVRLVGEVITALSRIRPALADRLAAAQVARCRRGGSPSELAGLQIELWGMTSGPGLLALAEEIVGLGATVGSAHLEAVGHLERWVSAVALGQGTFDDPVAARIGRLVDEAADPLLDWSWLSWLAVRAIAIGAFEEADRHLDRILRLPLHLGRSPMAPPATRVLSMHATARTWMAFIRNDAAGIEQAVRGAPGSWSWWEIDQRWLVSVRHATDSAASMGTLDDLTDSLRSMVRPTQERLITASILGDVAAPLGHRAGIDLARSVMLEHSGQHVVNRKVYVGTVDQHLGWIDLYTGQWDDAVARLSGAIEQLHAVGSPPYVVRINRNLAAALRGRGGAGDVTRADELEREAELLAGRLGVLGGTYRPPLDVDR